MGRAKGLAKSEGGTTGAGSVSANGRAEKIKKEEQREG